MNYSNILVAVQ